MPKYTRLYLGQAAPPPPAPTWIWYWSSVFAFPGQTTVFYYFQIWKAAPFFNHIWLSLSHNNITRCYLQVSIFTCLLRDAERKLPGGPTQLWTSLLFVTEWWFIHNTAVALQSWVYHHKIIGQSTRKLNLRYFVLSHRSKNIVVNSIKVFKAAAKFRFSFSWSEERRKKRGTAAYFPAGWRNCKNISVGHVWYCKYRGWVTRNRTWTGRKKVLGLNQGDNRGNKKLWEEQQLLFTPVRDFQYPPKSGFQWRKREKHSLSSSGRLPGTPGDTLASRDRRCFSNSALLSACKGLCLNPEQSNYGIKTTCAKLLVSVRDCLCFSKASYRHAI